MSDKQDDPIDASWYENRDLPQPGEQRAPPGAWLGWVLVLGIISWLVIATIVAISL